jgi:putative ABC transport system permease protein
MPDWRAYVRDRLPALACSPEREAEIVEELAQQLQDIYVAALRAGASSRDAGARVDAEIPDWPALARDLMQAEQPVVAAPRAVAVHRMEPAMQQFPAGQRILEILRDARLSARALLSQPLLTLTTVLTFALGIGATAVVFSLVHSVLLSPLPYREPDRLAVLQQVIPEIAERVPILGVNPRSFTAWEQACRTTCEAMAAIATTTTTLTGVGEPVGIIGARITPGLFDVLGVPPLLGRPFTAEDDVPGRNRVVIVSHAFWQGRLAGDPAVVGRVLTLDGVAVEIVGVLPATFRLPQLPQLSAPNRVGDPFEFFRPMAWSDDYRRTWGEFDNMVIVRQPAGVSVQATEAELTAITQAEFAKASIHPYAVARPLIDGVTADARRPLWLVLAAVAAALLIACVNVAGLLGTRWAARQRELAIRTALGAGRWRLAQVVATETVWLAAAGGLLGYALASVSLRTILTLAPPAVPRLHEVTLDTTSLLATAAITAVCALLCTAVPAWRAARVDPGDTLRAGSLTMTPGSRWTTIRAWLVGGEVALTTGLLLVGGLLVASFINVVRIDRGFTTAAVVAADIELPNTRYPDAAARAAFFDALLESLGRAPGIHAAGLARRLPLEGDATVDVFVPEGDAGSIAAQPVGNHIQVSAGYFQVMGLPLLRGRLMTPDDHARRVAVISERTGRTLWPGQDPVGRTFRRGRSESWQVIGIVADSRIRGFERDPGLVAYVPYGLNTRTGLSLAVRGNVDDATTIASARRVVRELDPDLPLQRLRMLDSVVDDALAMRRFQVRLMTAFGAAGLLLACLGIYGVLSGMVEGRRGELAIRLALGASPARVRQLIIRQGLKPVIAGLAMGLAGGLGAARLAASLLFGVTPAHPVVIGAVVAIVLAVAIAACLAPAARAARTSFASAFRGA